MVDQSEIRPGTELAEGRYAIVEAIGEGSMGRVYLALDRHLETDVVVKFPLPEGADLRGKVLLDRFGREARSLVALSHPHVVKILDVGHLEGNPFVVMHYLAGGSLKDRYCAGGRAMSPESLRSWLPDVARALDFVHDRGFVHRDVKPANILFDGHGNPFLGDFGIIKALAAAGDPEQDARASALTAPGYLMGTPNYIAPEIVLGHAWDGRSDQYSLALMVHELLSGRNVMSGPSPSATLVNQTSVEAPPLTELVPHVPERLSSAIRRSLSKDPEARFATCSELAREILADVEAGSDAEVGLRHDSGLASARTISSSFPTLPKASREALVRRRAILGIGASAALAAAGGGAWWIAHRRGRDRIAARPSAAAAPVALNVAYGTEKKKWLEAALADFRLTPEGRNVAVRLVPMGSVEGARAVLDGPGRVPIHVWSPASSVYRDAFERAWTKAHGSSPIVESRDLALTPLVFVSWKSRHDAFAAKYGALSFATIGRAMEEETGWDAIAGKPEWGSHFKFGHTDPNRSNSGLMTLVLLAHELAGKPRELRPGDLDRPEFRAALERFERGVPGLTDPKNHSTGTLMEEMVKRGPSQYDALIVYENLAIDSLQHARDRWGELRVDYPDPNLWCENPYYILDVPWSGPGERAAAVAFLDFLLGEPTQRKALAHGFRPGNPAIGVNAADSPLMRASASGVRLEVPRVCPPPKAEVVEGLLRIASEIAR